MKSSSLYLVVFLGTFSSLSLTAVSAEKVSLVSFSSETNIRYDSAFSYRSVEINSDAIIYSLTSLGSKLFLPSPNGQDMVEAKVTSVDTGADINGTVVYSGELYDRGTDFIAGKFIYANAKGSKPYLSVIGAHGSYEVFYSGEGAESAVLKQLYLPVVPGVTDPENDELEKALLEARPYSIADHVVPNITETDQIKSANTSSSRSSCVVDIGVGYSSNAKARNSSIVSTITSLTSRLNQLVSEIGVSCSFRLVGTKEILSFSESSHLVTDYNAMTSNSEILNWKNNVVNADIFVLISSNAVPHSDPWHGAVRQDRQNCGTVYQPGVKCGEYAYVRDDYAGSIYVYTHEILHITGAKHEYAYGSSIILNYGGNGFASQNNNSERSVTGGGIRSTSIMSNPPPNQLCGVSWPFVNNPNCGYRLPFIASKTKLRQYVIFPNSIFNSTTGYFPGFYPSHTTSPFGQSSPSMAGVIQDGMNKIRYNQ